MEAENNRATKTETLCPFSNGTEAMMWYDENCDRCKKAFHPNPDKGWPTEATLRKYVSIGKYCKLQYHMDMAFITSEIPMDVAMQIGVDQDGDLKWNCIMFSDNDNDGYHPKRGPKPDNSPDNQLCLPILLNEIAGEYSKVREPEVKTPAR